MANIRTFDTPALSLRPSETGVEATAGAARRIGAFSNQLGGATDELARNTESLGQFKGNLLTQTGAREGSALAAAGDQYVKYEDHKEISHGTAVGTAAVANLSKSLNDTVAHADPNDSSVAAKFMETQFEPWADNFKAQFTTENSQKFAEGFVDKYRQHFQTNADADMATMGGIAAKQNAQALKNNLSSMVYLDPSSLDTNIDVLKHSAGHIVDSSPTVDAVTGAKIKAELNMDGIHSMVMAAGAGMVAKNPNIDLDAFQKKYADYISGGDLKTLQKAAQTQAKANTLVDKQAAIAQRQIDDQKVHAAAAKTLADNVQVDPQTNQTTISPKFFKDNLEMLRNNPAAPNAAEVFRTMQSWGEGQQNKERKVVTDPAATSAIDANMFTDNPTSKMDILKLEAAGKLTRSDAEIRSKIIDQRDKLPSDPRFKMAMDGAKELIEGRSPGEKSLQSGKYAAFMQDFFGEYQRQKAAGTLPPNALNLSDPDSLISKMIQPNKSPLAAAISGNGGIGPRNDAMPAIPAPAQRPAGSIYETPKGKMKWTGTGWVQP